MYAGTQNTKSGSICILGVCNKIYDAHPNFDFTTQPAQCLYLLDKLCETLNDAKAYIHGLSPQNIERTHHTLEYLARTAKEAEILVGCCCDAEWIQAAMIFANAQEHFASLTFKLRLYMELLQSIFEEGATKKFLTKLQDQKWIDGVKDEEFHFIAEKAKEDRQKIAVKIDSCWIK